MQFTKILFVCLGNICRSPMAEFIMKDKVKKLGLSQYFQIDSAGTSGWHNGENMHCGTADILDQHKIESHGFVSSQVKKSDLDFYDYIVAMDDSNLSDLEKLLGKSEKIFKITALCPDLGIDHIPDPWYTRNFTQTHQLLNECCEALLTKIIRK